MKSYELSYLILPEMSEEEAKAFQEKIASLIKEEGGVLNDQGIIERIRLAYNIQKQSQAYLAVLNFQQEPLKLTELEKKLKLEKQILRYLILFKKKLKPISQKRQRPEPIIKKERVVSEKEKKVELQEIDKKLEEILQ